MTEGDEIQPGARAQVFRARHGRWLGGVCAGLPPVRGLGTGWYRLAFILAALCGGLGIVVYLACWLVIPTQAGAQVPDRTPAAVIVSWAAAGAAVATLIGLLSAVATVFGFGWVVFAVAAVVFMLLLWSRWRLKPIWALVTLSSLVLPAMAVALSPLRLTLQTGDSVVKPLSNVQLRTTTYTSGMGTLLIDLRHTQLPAGGTVPLRIDAGLRRTIVALPNDRCVHVTIHYQVQSFALRLAALLSAHPAPLFSDVVLFGRLYSGGSQDASSGVAVSQARMPGPTLAIDFASQGGSLFVRNYPDAVAPNQEPNWPGFANAPEPRPDINGEPRAAAKYMLHFWRVRLRLETRQYQQINRQLPGPCDPPPAEAR